MEPAKQELQPQKNGVESSDLKISLQSPRIAAASQESIVQVLRLAMMKVGLRAANFPSPEETAVLLEHIYSNYSGNTVAEIKLAFDMAISGKLDVEVNCYENFSCAYFSTIMNAYRAWSVQEYRQAIKPEMMEPRILTDEQLEDIHREDVENFYQRLRNGRVPNAIPEYFGEILKKDGLLKDETLAEFFTRKLSSNAECLYRRDI